MKRLVERGYEDVVGAATVESAFQSAQQMGRAGAMFLAVVDPGVGSSRRAVCLVTNEALWLGPDNGLLSLAAPAAASSIAPP